MTLTDISKEVDKLEMSEKLLLVEEIWDSIALNNVKLPNGSCSIESKIRMIVRYTSN